MTQSGGNGQQQDYDPYLEFEYLDADVWLKADATGNQTVAYTQDVLDSFESDESEENPNSETQN